MWGRPPPAVRRAEGPRPRHSTEKSKPLELRSRDSRGRLSPHSNLLICRTGTHYAPQRVPLNLQIVAEPLQPQHLRLAAEPGQLALGVIAVGLLSGLDGLFAGEVAAQELDGLLVTERSEW